MSSDITDLSKSEIMKIAAEGGYAVEEYRLGLKIYLNANNYVDVSQYPGRIVTLEVYTNKKKNPNSSFILGDRGHIRVKSLAKVLDDAMRAILEEDLKEKQPNYEVVHSTDNADYVIFNTGWATRVFDRLLKAKLVKEIGEDFVSFHSKDEKNIDFNALGNDNFLKLHDADQIFDFIDRLVYISDGSDTISITKTAEKLAIPRKYRNGICLKAPGLTWAMQNIPLLESMSYCKFLEAGNLASIKILEARRVKILILTFNTESNS